MMRYKDFYKHKGIYLLKKVNTKTLKVIEKKIIYNTLTDIALNEIVKPFYGGVPDIEVLEFAIGTGTDPEKSDDTTLQTEVFRTSKTDQNVTGTGEVTTEFILSGVDYTGAINEIGIFAGSLAAVWGAGAGKDTGLLVSRRLWSTILSADEAIYVQRIENFG